jgi:short-subunit dehydrogenase involved in D-alanine esterification of teichoic acids
MKLADKRILVTGGGSGIGLELARRLAADNRVVIAGRSTRKLFSAREDDPRLRPVQLDVTSEASATEAIDRIRSDLGGLDLLVNNAGVMIGGPLTAPDAAASQAQELAVDLEGAIRMTRLALPLLEAAPDAGVVFMSSAVALTAVPGLSVYAAAKAALHSFARSLRAELDGTSVRVFEVLPPVVDTELARGIAGPKLAPSAVADKIIEGIERGRTQIPVAQVRPLMLLARLAPRTADRIVQRAVRPSERTPRPAAFL